jgi:hypothetical protein
MKKALKSIRDCLYYIIPTPITFRCHKGWTKLKRNTQRFKRGYADIDVWNFCDWYLEIIPKMLTQLKEENYGFPADITEEQWEEYLTGMIDNFNNARTYEEKASEEIDYKKANDLYTKSLEYLTCGMNMLRERFFDLWD